jgi:hypothetical protein
MLGVTPDLLVCECSSYGRVASMKGAAAEARALIERSGGFAALRKKLEKQEADAATERRRNPPPKTTLTIQRDVDDD